MIYYFNPGHETAVLNRSKYYQPAANQLRMQRELASLPLWYAGNGDFVWLETEWDEAFRKTIQGLNINVKPLSINELSNPKDEYKQQSVEMWGISPASIHYFEKLNKQYGLDWQIPGWRNEYRDLGSRFTARKVLVRLIELFSGIDHELLPRFFSSVEDLENFVVQSEEKQLAKSPYSSSGRGLVWLPPEKLARSERQIISGMLKKQAQVSVEKALDKQLDFSMHFVIDANRSIRFGGYSVFQTNEKGAYQSSRLVSQTVLKQQISAFFDPALLQRIQEELLVILQEIYTPYYMGNIGVDMLVYRSDNQYRLHPCVEINMRKSMGYLAICLFERYLHPFSGGDFCLEYHSQPEETWKNHLELQQRYPLIIKENRMVSGYLSLCPVSETTAYHAFVLIRQ